MLFFLSLGLTIAPHINIRVTIVLNNTFHYNAKMLYRLMYPSSLRPISKHMLQLKRQVARFET